MANEDKPPGAVTPLTTSAYLTQIAVEQWAQGSPVAQLTQVAIEEWASTGTTATQALLTQLAIEQWASSPPPGGARAMVMVMA